MHDWRLLPAFTARCALLTSPASSPQAKGLAALKALTALQIGTSCVSRLLSSDVLGEWSYVQCEIRPPNITNAGVRQVLREC
jgi:hypothetical protein